MIENVGRVVFSETPEEQKAQSGEPEKPTIDPFDEELSRRMVDEGCPNCREDD